MIKSKYSTNELSKWACKYKIFLSFSMVAKYFMVSESSVRRLLTKYKDDFELKLLNEIRNDLYICGKMICVANDGSGCKEIKLLGDFYFRKDLGKYKNICKNCVKKQSCEWAENNKSNKNEYNKQRYLDKKEEIREYGQSYYQNNKDIILKRNKQYRVKNKEQISVSGKKSHSKYYQKNKSKINKKRKDRKKIDLNCRISCNLRTRLGQAIRNNQKFGSAVKDLGCSIPKLKQHLELQFKPGMSWENYGLKGWHIDHIKPLSSYDLTDREQFLEACNYTNLQPLWAEDNLKKGSKILNN